MSHLYNNILPTLNDTTAHETENTNFIPGVVPDILASPPQDPNSNQQEMVANDEFTRALLKQNASHQPI